MLTSSNFAQENTQISVRFRKVSRNGSILTQTKTFKNQAAMEKWVEKQEETSESFLGIVAFSEELG